MTNGSSRRNSLVSMSEKLSEESDEDTGTQQGEVIIEMTTVEGDVHERGL